MGNLSGKILSENLSGSMSKSGQKLSAEISSGGGGGSNGITPHIGENGNWFLGLVDTGVPATGPAGEDGFSPTVSVDTIAGGHRVSITDANGTKTFDVMDGEDGTGGETITLGHALYYDENGRLSVQMSDEPEMDNTLPISSAAVHTTVGNIEILLKTI